MVDEFLNKTKKAFKVIKTDIDSFNKTLEKLNKQNIAFLDTINISKESQSREIKKIKKDINSDFEKRTISFHNELQVMNELLRKTEVTFQKYLTKTQKQNKEQYNYFENNFKTIEMDFNTTSKNITKLDVRTNSLKKVANSNGDKIQAIKKEHIKLIKNSEKVVELKKILQKSISDINLNKIEAKEIKIKITEDKKNITVKQDNLEKVVQDNAKQLSGEINDIKTKLNQNQSNIEKNEEELHKSTNISEEKVIELNNKIESQFKIIDGENKLLKKDLIKISGEKVKLQEKIIKINETNKDILNRIKGLEKRNIIIKDKLTVTTKDKDDKLLNKTKKFLFNLFFEEVETQEKQKVKTSNKTKLQK